MKTNSINFSLSRLQKQAILLGVVSAVLWWLIALFLYTSSDAVLVWFDQEHIFRLVTLENPYATWGFINPVWVAVLIHPFNWLSLELSTLVQALIYYIALALVIVKYGGGRRELLVTLFSFPCLDAVLQMNLDWLVVVGMLLPVWASGPFLFAKPQLGIGYYFGKSIRDWFKAGIVLAVIGVITIPIWGWWPQIILSHVGDYSISRFFNIAPINYLGIVSIIIGVALAVWAFRNQDVPVGVLAWLFFTPYIAPYSLPLLLGMVSIKWYRLAFIFTVAYWIVVVLMVGPPLLESFGM